MPAHDDDDEPRSKKKGKDDAFSEKSSAGGKRRRNDEDDEKEADGSPPVKKSNTLWFVLAGVGLAAIFGCCCLPGGGVGYWYWSTAKTAEEREKKVESEPGLAVTADQLTKDYQENITAANSKYKDKVLLVSGNIQLITADAVVLRPGVLPGKAVLGGVHCTLADKNKGQLMAMKLNDNVRIKGYCTGEAILNPVVLLYCKKVD